MSETMSETMSDATRPPATVRGPSKRVKRDDVKYCHCVKGEGYWIEAEVRAALPRRYVVGGPSRLV